MLLRQRNCATYEIRCEIQWQIRQPSVECDREISGIYIFLRSGYSELHQCSLVGWGALSDTVFHTIRGMAWMMYNPSEGSFGLALNLPENNFSSLRDKRPIEVRLVSEPAELAEIYEFRYQ